ncbi:GDP-D-glucose phosphorylase 1-like isoform X2 [Stegodyphus dumicola]|nr:GDP-D-glucose phosphorylase 1-like isoform X2 [Stegodyphus dumicola]XP_035224724.1 GDP-D-glucose phosphorylase 1-like isoform X2 [Stegodyphus dumicola]
MDAEFCTLHSYSSDQFAIHTHLGKKSQFDHDLELHWQDCMRRGFFRYGLDDIQTKRVAGRYGFIAQLNIKRAVERRKPQFVSDVIMPFDAEIFNFTKVKKNEILFQLNPLHRKKDQTSNDEKSVLIINVSPLEYCHSLLVPGIENCYPQVLTLNGLKLGIEMMMISYNPSLKIGFNSLGAYASVNHLHFHVYYLPESLFIQHAPVVCLMRECYVLKCFPSEGFVFQLLEKENIEIVARSVMKLIEFLLAKKIAHNVLIMRGSSFSESSSQKNDLFNSIRIYVWARKPSFGSKNDLAFNPALCELGGHLPIKELKYFESITEAEVADILYDVCHETFIKIKDDVEKLYS